VNYKGEYVDNLQCWIAITRDGTETLVKTYTLHSEVYNADGSRAKQLTEEEAKAWKAQIKKESKRKRK
jgi:hypothetical protein